MSKAIIQPFEMREFVSELVSMLQMAEKIGAPILSILQDERSNRFLFV